VLRERKQYRLEAVDQIAAAWGGRQTVTGPVLAVPYTYRAQVTRTKMVNGNAVQVDENSVVQGTAYFLPEDLNVRGSVEPETRYRGIHEATVYGTSLNLRGSFAPDFAAAGIAADSVAWNEARIMFGVSDPKGVRSVSEVRVGEASSLGSGSNGGTTHKFDVSPQGRVREGELDSNLTHRSRAAGDSKWHPSANQRQ